MAWVLLMSHKGQCMCIRSRAKIQAHICLDSKPVTCFCLFHSSPIRRQQPGSQGQRLVGPLWDSGQTYSWVQGQCQPHWVIISSAGTHAQQECWGGRFSCCVSHAPWAWTHDMHPNCSLWGHYSHTVEVSPQLLTQSPSLQIKLLSELLLVRA